MPIVVLSETQEFFTVTRNDIIRDALLEIKAIDPSESLSPVEIADCSRRLNMMVKSWNRRPYLYTREEFQITLTPGKESYTIGAGGDVDLERPVRVEAVRREDSNGTEVPIDVVSRQEYKDLPQKDTLGPPNLVYYDPQSDLGVLYVWPTGQTGNALLNVTSQRQISDFARANDNPDVPKEAYMALYLNLAVNVARMFGVDPSPGLMADAARALSEWEDFEEEDASLFLQPDYRGY